MLEVKFRTIQQPLLNRYETAKENLIFNMNEKIKELRLKIQNCNTILQEASPSTIFKRGYSMVKLKNGEILRDSLQTQIGEEIEIIPANGKIIATVNQN